MAVIGGGSATLAVFVVLGLFMIVGYLSLRRHVRGIDFEPDDQVAPTDDESGDELAQAIDQTDPAHSEH